MGSRSIEVLVCDTHEEMAEIGTNIGVKDPKKCNGTAVRKYQLWIDTHTIDTGETEENEAGDKVAVMKTIPGHFEEQAHCDKAMKPYLEFMASIRGKGPEIVPEQFRQEAGQQTIPGTPPARSNGNRSANGASQSQRERAVAAAREYLRNLGFDIKDRGRLKDEYVKVFLNSEEGKQYAGILG